MAKRASNNIHYTECFVAFVDILGFSNIVARSVKEPALLSKLTQATNFMAEVPSGTKQSRRVRGDGSEEVRTWQVQTRAFSDTVVIFMPVEAGSISQMLFMVRYLHDRMLELGLCVRGAVTIGGMYWNGAWSNPDSGAPGGDQSTGVLYERGRNQEFPVTLGPGLIEAYKLETECAIYPRILVSTKIRKYVEEHAIPCVPFGPYQPPDRRLTDFFRVDADGMSFLDLLHRDVTRNDTEKIVRTQEGLGSFSIRWHRDGNTQGEVLRHVDNLLAGREKLSDKIRAKYEWLKTYRDGVQI